MAKKAAAPKPPVAQPNQQLVEAIVTVKNLQDFIGKHQGVESALAAVAGVRKLVEMTGGFDSLSQAIGIVGGQTPCEPSHE